MLNRNIMRILQNITFLLYNILSKLQSNHFFNLYLNINQFLKKKTCLIKASLRKHQ